MDHAMTLFLRISTIFGAIWLSLGSVCLLALLTMSFQRRPGKVEALCPACNGQGWAGEDDIDACALCDGDARLSISA